MNVWSDENLFDLHCYNFESFHRLLRIKLSAWDANSKATFIIAIIFRLRRNFLVEFNKLYWMFEMQINEMKNIFDWSS